jgi:Uma2 family endonuclease
LVSSEDPVTIQVDLEVSVAMRVAPLLTVSDLDDMPEDGNRYELIEGELFVSKAPGITHQLTFGTLFDTFSTYLKSNPIGKIIATPGLILSDLDAVIPDLVFIRNERLAEVISGERLVGPPDLVIEILSPGRENETRDRVAKRQLYGKFGVREYWIVDPKNRVIELYLLELGVLEPKAVAGPDGEIVSSVLLGFRCRASDIFAA